MRPFDLYPNDGVSILPKMKLTNCRHEYGLKLQQLTKQTECAYCGVDLTSDFYRWLLLSVDHVIPVNECKRLGIPEDWAQSYSNVVLCCLGCNGFNNRYQIHNYNLILEWTPKEFFNLRNEVFNERKKIIGDIRAREISYFNSHPWE